ncbi:MAG: SgcJ/EcaC family oxidoreductase [Pseudomonadota bacterium]
MSVASARPARSSSTSSVATAVVAFLLGGCGVTGAGAEADAIRRVGQAWISAYDNRDFDKIPELYTEDAWIMPRGRPKIVGREALRQALGGLAAGREIDIDVAERELVVAGDIAWFISDFRVTYGGTAGGAVTENGRSLIIYKRGHDGRWRVHRDIDSPAPPIVLKARSDSP